MKLIIKYLKKNPHLLILSLILLLGLFFRTYQILERLGFAHDADLYSWIVKDILVNHHFRLIGQLTSAPGIFIGSLFYYLTTPFFLLTRMDPLGVSLLGASIGLLTIFSYYFVISKIFNKTAGLIAAFLHAILASTISFDRWIVPTLPTKLWVIWYLYTILMISKGNFYVLPLLAILIGLIWHVHIALAPTLVAVPLALVISKKIPKKKELLIFFLILFITSLPLIIFEARHNFSQTKALIENYTSSFGSGNSISEKREVALGKELNYAELNLNPSTKFSLEVTPPNPQINSNVELRLSTKNPKYSTMNINLDCGHPRHFELGSVLVEFDWSTKGCSEGSHFINIEARTITDPIWKITGFKFLNILEKVHKNIQMLLYPAYLPELLAYLFSILALSSSLIAWKIKILHKTQTLIFYSLIFSVILFFTLSSIVISEYYLVSIDVPLIISLSLIFSKIYKKNKFGKYLIIILLFILLLVNFLNFINDQSDKKGYLERKSTVQFIKSDAQEKNFPCVSINYITQAGENVGFRYFIWLHNLKTVKNSPNVPTYNIVLPLEYAPNQIDKRFGNIGVITPKEVFSDENLEKECQSNDINLSEPMFGYVD